MSAVLIECDGARPEGRMSELAKRVADRRRAERADLADAIFYRAPVTDLVQGIQRERSSLRWLLGDVRDHDGVTATGQFRYHLWLTYFRWTAHRRRTSASWWPWQPVS